MNDMRSLAFSVTVREALDYLQILGWSISDHPNSKLFVLRPSGAVPQVEIVLPRSSSAPDFVPRLIDAACLVGAIRETTPETVLRNMRNVATDVFSARVMSVVAEGGSLPLDAAYVIVGGLKDLIAHGAGAELTSMPYLTKLPKNAVKHVHQCRFGHTFDGSFGFIVESPFAPDLQGTLTKSGPPPFERRVVERVYRGLGELDRAVAEGSVRALVDGYEDGLNANMCDALISMSNKTPDLSVEYRVLWSPKIEHVPMNGETTSVKVGPAAYEALMEASRQLKAISPKDVLIEGRVVMLKSDTPPWEDEIKSPHTVVVAWVDPEGKATRTQVQLQPSEYVVACDAHKSGRTVAIRGTLERQGKKSRLSNEFRRIAC